MTNYGLYNPKERSGKVGVDTIHALDQFKSKPKPTAELYGYVADPNITAAFGSGITVKINQKAKTMENHNNVD